MSPDTRTLAICGRAKVCVTLSLSRVGGAMGASAGEGFECQRIDQAHLLRLVLATCFDCGNLPNRHRSAGADDF